MGLGAALMLATPLWLVLTGLVVVTFFFAAATPSPPPGPGGGCRPPDPGLGPVFPVLLRGVEPGRLPGRGGLRPGRLARGDADGDRRRVTAATIAVLGAPRLAPNG